MPPLRTAQRLDALNAAFLRDVSCFGSVGGEGVDVDISSMMRQYLGFIAEIKG